ncbi:MAG: hypothetical protein IIA88_08530 [Bacteroidetes bacterium]|nr:hypothetical protein [Bacteroidota bacterium]
MENLKQNVITLFKKLPEDATIDDMMYRLYVIEKIRKGQEAVMDGKTISVEDLKKEMKSW